MRYPDNTGEGVDDLLLATQHAALASPALRFDSDEDADYDDESEEDEDDTDEEGNAAPTEQKRPKTPPEFVPDEVDELDAFLKETSISSESRKYFKDEQGALTPSKSTTAAKDAANLKWLDSVLS